MGGGPAIGVQYGLGLFRIATIAVSLQVVFNLEAIRYTLCTGEPIITGFMRLKPSSRFWGTLYALLTAAQLGLPSVVGGCAAVLFAAFAGRIPETSGAPLRWVDPPPCVFIETPPGVRFSGLAPATRVWLTPRSGVEECCARRPAPRVNARPSVGV